MDITTPGAKALKSYKLAKTAGRRREFDDRKKLQATLSREGWRNDLLPRCEITHRRLDDVRPATRKVRALTTPQVERVARSIRQYGFIGAIIVRGGRIVDGHVRYVAAQQLGLGEIPCIDVDHLSEEEARVLTIGLNRIAELGAFDFNELKVEMDELLDLKTDLTLTGFSAQEIDVITLDEPEPIGGAEEDEGVPETPERPVSQLGDVFVLASHRIACADALKPESYDAILGSDLTTMVATDPPYNVAIRNNVSGLGKKTHGEFAMASGEMTPPQFHEFLRAFLERCKERLIPGGALMSFMDWRSIHTLINAGLESGLSLVNLAVWDKGSGSMGAYLRSTHELCPIFCNGDTLAINNVALGRHGRDRQNVWRFAGANRPGSSAAEALADHPTPKSVPMIADAILDVSHRKDIVLDPFLGSGTTLIAAEKTGRVCRGLELDPRYVDVIVRRWEKLTGQEAIHEATGRTFAELADLRGPEVDASECRKAVGV